MSRITKTETIGAYEVTVVQHPSVRGFKLFTRIARLLVPVIGKLGPMLGVVVKEDFAMEDLMKFPVENLSGALTAMFSQLDDATAESILLEVLSGTTVVWNQNGTLMKADLVDGQKAVDTAFDGELASLLKVAGFALKVNFRDFLGGSVGRKQATPTPSP